MTKEMEVWLGANMETFEQIMVHAMLHDPPRRTVLLGAGLTHEDFVSPLTALLFCGVELGAKTNAQMGREFPEAPSLPFLASNLVAVNAAEAIVTPQELADAIKLGLALLKKELYADAWHSVESYFDAWLGTSTMKKMAKRVSASRVLNPSTVATMFQRASTRSASVFANSKDDLEEAMSDMSEKMIERFDTGFDQLNDAIGGGFAGGECGVIVGGTGSGKSVLVSQIATHLLGGNEPVSVISTEMPAVKYLARMVANRCRISISKFVNCQNWRQIEQIVASNFSSKLEKLDQLNTEIRSWFGFKKLDPDNGLAVRSVLDAELIRFEQARGCRPKLMMFDWMGRMVDDSKAGSSADRSAIWERVADEYVKFSDATGIAVVVLAQAVNNSSLFQFLDQSHIACGKGIIKQMHWAVMLTNYIDKEAQRASTGPGGDALTTGCAEAQRFCIPKSRNGASSPPIEISRSEMQYQRFIAATQK